MTFAFKLPDIGEGIAEGELLQWLVKPGDSVKEDQPLFEVMTDKVTVEIPSPVSGVVQELLVTEGSVVPVGATLLTLDVNGNAGAVASKEMPVETAARQTEAAAPTAAKQESAPSEVGTEVRGQVACTAKAQWAPANSNATSSALPVLAAPATRAKARALGIDLERVRGSGPHGRVTPEDLDAYQNAYPEPQINVELDPYLPAVLPREDTVVAYTGIRRRTGDRMLQSHQGIPSFALVETVDATALVQLRKRLKEKAKSEGLSLTYLPFIIKAVVEGLKAVPALNSRLDEAKGEIIQFGAVHLNIAMDTHKGLVVPVLADADTLSVKMLAQRLQQLSAQAKNGTLTPQQMEGGTFTVSSMGNDGALFGIPMVNPPQVGIVGVHAIKKRPVILQDDTIGIGHELNISLSADHRVVDGMAAGRFLAVVKRVLEEPETVLF